METPELEKITSNAHNSQLIGEFIEWLADNQNIVLATYDSECDKGDHPIYYPIDLNIEQLLARYFDVDLAKAEKERRGLLDELRANAGPIN